MSSSLVLTSSFIKNLIIKASLLVSDRNTANVNLDALVNFGLVNLVAGIHPPTTTALSAKMRKVTKFLFTLRIRAGYFALLSLAVNRSVHPFREFKEVT